MKYQEKNAHVDSVVDEMRKNKSSDDQIRKGLKEKGLYNADIDSVIFSAKNVIGDKLRPIIKSKLLAGETILNTEEFEKLDSDFLERLEKEATKSIIVDERKKVNQLLKDGTSTQDIFNEIRLDFYPKEIVKLQVATFNEVTERNSGGSRMVYILGGIGLMLAGAGISYATMQGGGGGRLFYGLIIVGFMVMVKGFITVENPF